MPHYLISVIQHPDVDYTPEEEQRMFADVTAVNQKAKDDGIFVFANGLYGPGEATTVDARGATPVVTDGPFVETKEYVGGIWIIDVPDYEAAIEWSKKAGAACQRPLEVRPFHDAPVRTEA